MNWRVKKMKLSFYKYDYYILILFIIFILILIKTTDSNYLFNLKCLTILDKCRNKNVNDILFNVSIGFIVSTIFYFINIFLPKIENFKNNIKIIERNINVIYKALGEIFMMILNESDISKIQSCTEKNLKANILKVDPDINFQINGSSSKINIKIHENYFYLVVRHINYILNFNSIIGAQLLEILIRIQSPNIGLTMPFIKDSNKQNFRNYENELIELYKCYMELTIYKKAFIDKRKNF